MKMGIIQNKKYNQAGVLHCVYAVKAGVQFSTLLEIHPTLEVVSIPSTDQKRELHIVYYK